MKCPLYMSLATLVGRGLSITPTDCLQAECAWWNERFGMCSQAVSAYLTGIEDSRAETRAYKADRE